MNIISKSLSHNNISKSWLQISVASLALAGLIAIILIIFRTPVLQNFIPYDWFFKSALVVHVDLSVLLWLLSVSAMMFSLVTHECYYIISKTSIILARISLILLVASPFVGMNQPLMNNYIPVLVNLCFFLGLSCFACAIMFQVVVCILSYDKSNIYSYYIVTSAIIVVISFAAFVFSYRGLKDEMSFEHPFDHQFYFEYLFWAGGHLLQFSYVGLMQLSWLMMAGVNLDNKYLKSIFAFNILACLPCLLIFNQSIFEEEYISFFTLHMRYLGGVTPLLIGLYLLFSKKNLNSNIYSSGLLFASGGMIGFMITSSNVTIPAHYHGSIIAVSISFMGLVYLMMKHFDYKMPSDKSLKYQPILLALGQFIHIAGLSYAGGYGALRKTTGLSGDVKSQFGMYIMGIGGLLAVIGGISFIINSFGVLKGMFKCQKK
jgi:hypothetical protein